MKIPVWLLRCHRPLSHSLFCTVPGSSAALACLPLAGPQNLAHRQAGACQGRWPTEATHPRRSGPVPNSLSPIAHSLSNGGGVGQKVSVHGVGKILLATGQPCSSWLSFHFEKVGCTLSFPHQLRRAAVPVVPGGDRTPRSCHQPVPRDEA